MAHTKPGAVAAQLHNKDKSTEHSTMPQGSVRRNTGSWPSVLSKLGLIDLDTTRSLLSNSARHADGCTCLLPQLILSSPPKQYDSGVQEHDASPQQYEAGPQSFQSRLVAPQGEAGENAAFSDDYDSSDDEDSCASMIPTMRYFEDVTNAHESHTEKLPGLRRLRRQAKVKAAFINDDESDKKAPATPITPAKRQPVQVAPEDDESHTERCRRLRRREKSLVLRSKYVLQGLDGQDYLPSEDSSFEYTDGDEQDSFACDIPPQGSESGDDSVSPLNKAPCENEDFTAQSSSHPSSSSSSRVSILLPTEDDGPASVDNVPKRIKDSTGPRSHSSQGPSFPLPETPPRDSWLSQGYNFLPVDLSMGYPPPRSKSSNGANSDSEASVGTSILYSDAGSEDLLEDMALSEGSNSPKSDEEAEIGVAEVVHLGTPVRMNAGCVVRKV
ncbi:MAG: hypothetical protein M1831_006684 [Alyxoria varia]|nr:MAG: hypothetical protein M1831_006684 [Alyxoria varia]